MSTQSHKGQILPLANQLIPISQNTTFHASYNNSLIGLNQGQRISPYGYQTSVKFDGVDDYIYCGNGYSSNVFTISAWVKITADHPDVNIGQVIAATYLSGTGFILYINNGRIPGFRCHGGGGVDIKSSTALNLSQWYHMAGTYDGTTEKLYIDGTLVASATASGATNRDPMYIARASHASGNYVTGYISDIQFLNYARTQQQIKDNMNAELRGDESGLQGYWKLNDGSSTIARDSSMIGNDAVLTNGPTWSEGRTIATLRPDGKFGGAVAVEESTNNIIQNPTISSTTGWSYLAKNTVVSTDSYQLMSDAIGIPTNTYVRLTSGSDTNDEIQFSTNSFTLAPSTTYTVSFYARGKLTNGAGTNFFVLSNTGTLIQGLSNTYTPTPSWTRYSATFTTTSDITGTNQLIRFDVDKAGYIDITAVQLEQKTFATSFVNGSRSSGKIIYPTLLRPVGTVCFWAKFDEDYHTRTNWWARIIDQHSGSSAGTGIVLYSDGQVKLGISNTSFSTVNTGWQPYANKFYFMAFSYKSGEQHIYIGDDNGISELGTGVVTFPDTIFDQTFKIGWGNVTDNGNVIVSDLRIDSVLLSKDEIFAIYQSNAPLYNYLDYSGVVY